MSKVLLMFPGQGSQSVGMASWLLEYPMAADLYERATKIVGWDVLEVCQNGPAERLMQTDVAQPAIFVTSIATWTVLTAHMGWSQEPKTQEIGHECAPIMLGHSLGDYSALVACGHLSFEDGLAVVTRRSRAMWECGERQAGGMVAVLGLEDEIVRHICGRVSEVWPANYNSPRQVVVSGSREGLTRLAELVGGMTGARLVPLKVSGAFHSPLVAAATSEVAAALDEVPLHEATIGAFFSTTELQLLQARKIHSAMVAQLTSPVQFSQALAYLRSTVCAAVEVGPGKVLAGLVKRIDRSLPVYSTNSEETLQTVRDTLRRDRGMTT
ncbi:MAG: ACP S-malonyltransferase [Actinobacteria bacterium]|nr:ACP S-malonyltransferase [Actinomycetota bacterium]